MNRTRVTAIVSAIVFALIVGSIAYYIGVNYGLRQSGAVVMAPGGAHPHYVMRPWGVGYFFAPIFVVFFWFLIARSFFWRGGHGHYHGGCGSCGDSRFDDWHRRAHERMAQEPVSGAGPEK